MNDFYMKKRQQDDPGASFLVAQAKKNVRTHLGFPSYTVRKYLFIIIRFSFYLSIYFSNKKLS